MSRVTADFRLGVDTVLPTSVAAPILWLRAEDIRHVTDGGSVDYWVDGSQHQKACTQTTGANQPTWHANQVNGYPCVRFDGTNSFMFGEYIRAAGQVSYFAVIKNANATFATQGTVVGGSAAGAGNEEGMQPESGSTIWRSGGGQSVHKRNDIDMVSRNGAPINEWHVVSMQDAANAWSAGYHIGQDRTFTTRRWDGDFAEIIVLQGLFLTADITIVNNYLMTKYGIS